MSLGAQDSLWLFGGFRKNLTKRGRKYLEISSSSFDQFSPLKREY